MGGTNPAKGAAVSDLSPSRTASPARVLVVDDDPAVREMLARVLSEAGYDTLAAENGREALRVTANHRCDAALLDLGLGAEDGWTTLKQLRQREPALRVIIITAWPNQHQAAAKAGADACFEKPLEFAQLLDAIARLIGGETDRDGSAPGQPPGAAIRPTSIHPRLS